MSVAKRGDTVKVMEGVFKETVYISPGVCLLSDKQFGAVIDGGGRGTIVTLGTGATISGFEIKNGTIGVLSTSSQTGVTQCRITQNLQSGIMCVGHLPKIEDNLIVFNRGSGIQGWDVRTTSASINHNTIAYNGNHGIALGGNSAVSIENNIIAFNDQFGIKPGDETVRVELLNNNLFQNTKFSGNLPEDNISADPMFIDAKRHNFKMNKESKSVGLGTDNQNLGARIEY
ncbi:MAG: right-handed parallel beta-helix repeat-containing protein [Chitinispirillaceae bacterium]